MVKEGSKRIVYMFFAIFIFFVFALVSLASCNKASSEVRLHSLEGKAIQNNVKMVALQNDVVENTQKDSLEETTAPLDYQYIVLDSNENYEFVLSIILDNEKDYHIFDFTLRCSDDEGMILIDDEFKKINSLKSLNWRGDTNSRFDVTIKLSQDIEDTTLDIENLFFASRNDEKNHKLADLNNKGTFNVFKVNNGVKLDVTSRDDEKNYHFNYNVLDDRITVICLNNTIIDTTNQKEGTFSSENSSFDTWCEYSLGNGIKVKKTANYDFKLNENQNDYWFLNGFNLNSYITAPFEYNKLATENTTYKLVIYSLDTDDIVKECEGKIDINKTITFIENNNFEYSFKKNYFVILFDNFEIIIKF